MLRILLCLLTFSCGDSSGLKLHVAVGFRINAKGVQILALPVEWAEEKLHSMINLQVTSRGAVLNNPFASGEVFLHGSANHPVVIEYDLPRDWSGPMVNPLQFHPVPMPEYVEFTGTNALIRRVLRDNAEETANFDWQGLPPTWTRATSFGASANAASRCQTFTGPWNRVDGGLYAAGD
jgi:hypothetical protein